MRRAPEGMRSTSIHRLFSPTHTDPLARIRSITSRWVRRRQSRVRLHHGSAGGQQEVNAAGGLRPVRMNVPLISRPGHELGDERGDERGDKQGCGP